MRKIAINRRLRKVKKAVSLLVLGFFVYASYFEPMVNAFVVSGQFKQNHDRYNSGYFSPDAVLNRINKKKAVIDYQNRMEQMLDKKQQKVSKKISKNINESVYTHQQSMAALSQEAQLARQKVFAILGQQSMFNYIQYDDGKKVWMKDGLAVLVENERVIDAHGNVSIRHTYNMEYSKKRLLTNYDSETTDSLGNKTYVKWYGATYTNDSVFYATDETNASKLITAYNQEIVDSFGNHSKIEWSNGEYDGKLLINYNETYTDIRGNQSSKHWYGAKYDDNKQVTEFQEDSVDVKGNQTHRHWSGGRYIKNPAYSQADEKAGKSQSSPEYLLIGYKEVITDEAGHQTTRMWEDADYDRFGQLVSYQEIIIDALERQKRNIWTNGRYDDYGRLISYQEEKIAIDQTSTIVQWQAEGYNNQHRLQGFIEKRFDVLGNLTITHRNTISYNNFGDALNYLETVTDPLGNQVDKVWENGQYDRYGRLIAYEESSKDSYDQITHRHWHNAQFDSHDRLLSYQETITDPLGNVSSKIWEQGTYDYLGRLIGYHEANTDSLGHTSHRWWRDAVYDALDHQAAYTEIRQDVFGHPTTVRWQAGKIDNKNIHHEGTKYTKEHKENLNKTFVYLRDRLSSKASAKGDSASVVNNLEVDSGYNEFGQVTDYIEEVTDIYGQVSYRVFSDGQYDRYGRQLSYEETYVNADGSTSSKTWQNARYDHHGRLKSYQEVWTYPGGLTSIHDWFNATYDTLGRLTSVNECFSDSNGNESRRNQNQIHYNQLHQMVSYEETISTNDIDVHTIWQAGSFDEFGRIRSSRSSSVSSKDPQVEIVTEVKDRAYDDFGEACGGEEIKTITGTTHDNKQVNLTTRTYFTNINLIPGKIANGVGSLNGYTQLSETTGLDPNGTLMDWQEILTVSDITPFSRKEMRRTQAPGLDHTITTERTEMVRNSQGQLTGYVDEIWDEATPAGITRIERSGMVYNSQSQVMGYQELVTELTGLVSERMVSGLLYNGLGQQSALTTLNRRTATGFKTLPDNWEGLTDSAKLHALQDQVNSIGNGISWSDLTTEEIQALVDGETVSFDALGSVTFDRETHTLLAVLYLTELSVKEPMTYDVAGRLTHYQEQRINQGSQQTTTIDWQAAGFTSANLVAGERIDSTTGERTTTTIRNNMTYNLTGQLLAYLETITDSQTPDLITTRTISNRTYDSLGRLAEQKEVEHISGKTADDLPQLEQLNQALMSGLTMLAAGDKVIWEQLTETQKQALLDGQTVAVTGQSGRPLELSLAPGSTVLVETTMDLTTTRIRQQASFDQLGRLSGYTESVHSTGQNLDKLETTVRDQITYNDKHQIIRYHETFWSNLSPQLSSDRWMTDITYDALGQMTGYQEKVIQQAGNGNDFYLELITNRSGILYNPSGQMAGYHDQVTRSDQAGLIKSIDRINMTYDDQGHLLSYDELENNGQGLITETNVTNIDVNRLGQEKSREETITTKGYDPPSPGFGGTSQGNLVYETNQSRKLDHQRYNAIGQKIQSVETITSEGSDLTQTVIFAKGRYNEFGQLETFEEETRIRGVGAYSNTPLQINKIKKRTATDYNQLGQLTLTTDELTSSEAPDKITTETLQSITYDSHGRRQTWLHLRFEAPKGHVVPNGLFTRTDRTSTSYEATGLEIGFTETTSQSGQTANEQLDTGKTIERSNITHHVAGMVTGYEETIQSDTSTLDQDHAWQGTYNSSGQLISMTDITQTGAETVTTTRNGIDYNSLNQQTSYQETKQVVTKDLTNQTLVDMSTTTNRELISYDEQGRMLGYLDTMSSSDQPEVLTTVHRQDQGYDTMGHLTTWLENQTVAGQLPGQAYEVNTEIKRTGADYNVLGQLTGYQETRTDDSAAITQTINREQIGYDQHGRLSTYQETTQQQAADKNELDIETTINRQSTTYDQHGRLIGTTEIKTGNQQDDLIDTIVYTVNAFDQANRVTNYTQLSTITSKTKLINRVTNTKKQNITYNTLNQETGYTETSSSNTANDLTSERSRDNQRYNSYGQLIGYAEQSKRYDQHNSISITLDISRNKLTYDQFGRETSWQEESVNQDINTTTMTDYTKATYNHLGQLTTFEQIINKQGDVNAGVNAPAITTTIKRLDTSYNQLGQLVGQQDEQTSSDQSNLTLTTTLSNVTYNDRYERLTYDKTIHQLSSDNSLDMTQTVNRTKTIYDEAGRETSYEETNQSSASPDLLTTITKNEIKYNKLKQITGYDESTQQTGKDNINGGTIDHEQTISRSQMKYNNQGELKAYHQENVSPANAGSDATIIQDWAITDIDAFGRTTGYQETGSHPNQGNYTKTWTGTYNTLDQVIDLHETLESSNGSQDYKKHQSAITYNNKGQQISFTETGSAANNPKYTKTYQADYADSYNAHGQRVHYQETTTNDLGVVTNKEWSQGSYNGLGQLMTYHEL